MYCISIWFGSSTVPPFRNTHVDKTNTCMMYVCVALILWNIHTTMRRRVTSSWTRQARLLHDLCLPAFWKSQARRNGCTKSIRLIHSLAVILQWLARGPEQLVEFRFQCPSRMSHHATTLQKNKQVQLQDWNRRHYSPNISKKTSYSCNYM